MSQTRACRFASCRTACWTIDWSWCHEPNGTRYTPPGQEADTIRGMPFIGFITHVGDWMSRNSRRRKRKATSKQRLKERVALLVHARLLGLGNLTRMSTSDVRRAIEEARRPPPRKLTDMPPTMWGNVTSTKLWLNSPLVNPGQPLVQLKIIKVIPPCVPIPKA